MKHLGTLAILGAVLTASAPFALADNIGSYATGAGNVIATDVNTATTYLGFSSHTFGNTAPFTPDLPVFTFAQATGALAAGQGTIGTTFNLGAGAPPWAAPLANSTWIGITANAEPNGNIANNIAQGYYVFQSTIQEAGAWSGSISIASDDDMEVFLNGVLVPGGGFQSLGADGQCAPAAGGSDCTADESLAISGTGNEVLTFVVAQAGNENASDPSGLNYGGVVTSSAIPEPNSLMLLGTGLMSAAGMVIRRRRSA
jgi:PEP-CTERM motif